MEVATTSIWRWSPLTAAILSPYRRSQTKGSSSRRIKSGSRRTHTCRVWERHATIRGHLGEAVHSAVPLAPALIPSVAEYCDGCDLRSRTLLLTFQIA